MSIKRTYLPPFPDVMAAAETIGAGEFAERRRREDLALAELAQRDLAQRRSIAADQERQAVAVAANQQEQANRLALAGWQAALQERNILRGHEWDVAERDERRKNVLADQAAANLEWERRAKVDADLDWQVNSVDATEKGLNADLAGLLKAKDMLTQEGVRTLGNLMGKWRAIQGQRGNMPPAEYARILVEFGDELQKSGVHDHIKPPPTPEQLQQQFASETVTIADGPFKGVYGRDRSGAWRQVGKPEKETTTVPASFEQAYQDQKKFDDAYDDAKADLEKRRKSEFAAAQSAWEAKDANRKPEDPQTPEPVEPGPPTKSEVIAAMREKFEAYQSVQQPAGPPPALAPGEVGPQPEPPPPAPLEVGKQQAALPPAMAPEPVPPPLAPVEPAIPPRDAAVADVLQQAENAKVPGIPIGTTEGIVNIPWGTAPSQSPDEFIQGLAKVHNDDMPDLVRELQARQVPKSYLAAAQQELATRPPPGMDFPYGMRDRKPVPVLSDDELNGKLFRKGGINRTPGQMFIQKESGQVFLFGQMGTIKPVPQELLTAPAPAPAASKPLKTPPQVPKSDEQASAEPASKSLIANKPQEVRKRSFERDEAGLLKKETERYLDPQTGDLVTSEQILERDEQGRIIGSTTYFRRQKPSGEVETTKLT